MSRKRKKIVEESGSSSEWLLTFSDVLTLLITFFVLLISMSSMDSKKLKETSAFFTGALGNLEAGKGHSTTLLMDPRNSRPMPRPSLRRMKAQVGSAEQVGDTDELARLLREANTLAKTLENRSRYPQSKGVHPLDAATIELYAGARPIKLVRDDRGGSVSVHIGLLFEYGEARLRSQLQSWVKGMGEALRGEFDRIEMPVRESGSGARYGAPWLLAAWRAAAIVRALRPKDIRVGAGIFQSTNRSYVRLIWSHRETRGSREVSHGR